MTRAELAACLVRIAERQGRQSVSAAVTFSVVDAGAWYAKEVNAAAALGLVNGYNDGTFRPNNPVTRAEAVTMINRMLGRDPATAEELKTAVNPFADVKASHWAYWHILEASVEHKH
jgi:hypothetical protein